MKDLFLHFQCFKHLCLLRSLDKAMHCLLFPCSLSSITHLPYYVPPNPCSRSACQPMYLLLLLSWRLHVIGTHCYDDQNGPYSPKQQLPTSCHQPSPSYYVEEVTPRVRCRVGAPDLTMKTEQSPTCDPVWQGSKFLSLTNGHLLQYGVTSVLYSSNFMWHSVRAELPLPSNSCVKF